MQKQAQENSTATLGFEAKLWHAADLMRGKLPATQCSQVLMGLLFLRYVLDAFENRYRELGGAASRRSSRQRYGKI